MSDKPTAIPQAAAALGYAGALPFVLAAFAVWFVDPKQAGYIFDFLHLAGAVVLGFVAGVNLGIMMSEDSGPAFPQLGIATVMLGLSGLATILGNQEAFGLLIFAFAAQLFFDLRTAEAAGAPAWYRGLRIPLTVMVEISLIGALVKLLTS